MTIGRKTTPTTPEWAESVAAAARATGISRQSLSGYKRAGCPAFQPDGRVNLAGLAAWLDTHGKRTSTDTAEMRAERLRILRARANRLEAENAERAGLMVARSEAAERIRCGMMTVFSELDRLFCNELPPVLKGLDEVAILAQCRATIEQLRVTLKEKFTLREKKESTGQL